MSLLARDLLDGEPLKIDIGLDDIEESELASRSLRATCGKLERALASGVSSTTTKFPPVTFGENLALPPRARLGCGFARLGWGLRGLFRLLLRHGVTRSWVAIAPSGKVDCVTLEVAEIDGLQRRFMGRGENDARRVAGLERFTPARRTGTNDRRAGREIEVRLRRRGSLPRAWRRPRNSAVTSTQTVCNPRSSGPVWQQRCGRNR